MNVPPAAQSSGAGTSGGTGGAGGSGGTFRLTSVPSDLMYIQDRTAFADIVLG